MIFYILLNKLLKYRYAGNTCKFIKILKLTKCHVELQVPVMEDVFSLATEVGN